MKQEEMNMRQIQSILKAREKHLQNIKEYMEESLEDVPEGFLRISNYKGRTQYFHRTDPKDFSGAYITKDIYQIAEKLAQKEYAKKVIRAADKEIGSIGKFFELYPKKNVEEIYETLHMERRKLIKPIRESDETFVHNWSAVAYQGKGFFEDTPEFYTARKERVRSKSEWLIADILFQEGVPYRYEFPIMIKGIGTIYPDFTVLNVKQRKEMIWEHLGMMDDPSYLENALKKISTYEQNNIFVGDQLILTFETRKNPLSQKQVMRMIQRYLK